MQLRHAAALALVGWYLLVPPVNGAGSIASKAPIKHWTVLHWFGSEKACKEGLGNRDGLTTEMRDSGYAREGKVQTELLLEAQCIDENDSRFKGWRGAFIGRIR